MFHIELIIEFQENVMNNIVQVAILFFEFVGVIVIILSGLKGFYNYVRRVPDMKITLAQGLAVGLEFKLCSEILKTVIVRDWKEIVTVAGIIGLRAALTFLIHWEIKEEKNQKSAADENRLLFFRMISGYPTKVNKFIQIKRLNL